MIKRSTWDLSGGLTPKLINSALKEHLLGTARLDKLNDYYNGAHKIKCRMQNGRFAPNNRLVNSYPKYITDTVCGYVFGNSIRYQTKPEQDISGIINAFKQMDIDTHDSALAKDLSVFGKGIELLYFADMGDGLNINIALLDPRYAFVVYDDSVISTPLFGVYYFKRCTDDVSQEGYSLFAYTDSEIYEFDAKSLSDPPRLLSVSPHYLGVVPVLEYLNNEEAMGDFESVISLIDAYDILQSDRVNDKERFVNAILVIKNASLPEDSETMMNMLKNGILEMPGAGLDGSDCFYLTKSLNEADTEVLRKAIAADIHKFSQTPDFSDELFSGNTSGVAMKFKLLSLEYLAKIKERYFQAGLRKRLRAVSNAIKLKESGHYDVALGNIQIVFNRSMPINELENANTLKILSECELLSKETMLAQIPFVKDIEMEMEKAGRQEERMKQVKQVKRDKQDE